MQSLAMRDVPAVCSRQVHAFAIGRAAPDTDDLQLVAAAGSTVVIWRLNALYAPQIDRAPTYASWHFDSVIETSARHVTALSIMEHSLAVGTEVGLIGFEAHQTREGVLNWRSAWQIPYVNVGMSETHKQLPAANSVSEVVPRWELPRSRTCRT